MAALIILVPLLPLLAAAVIGGGLVAGRCHGQAGRQLAADWALWSVRLALLMAVAALFAFWQGLAPAQFSLGPWLGSDTLTVRANFALAGLGLPLAILLGLSLAALGHHASLRLGQQAICARFCLLYALLAACLFMAVLSANLVGTLLGWAGLSGCAYGLASHAWRQPKAATNGAWVLVGQRLGDAGLCLAISLCVLWWQQVGWLDLARGAAGLDIGQATGLSLCLVLAAAAKSAQWPFTCWLDKSLAGPIGAEAVLANALIGHVGVFLLHSAQPVLAKSPFAQVVLCLTGLATVLYCQRPATSQAAGRAGGDPIRHGQFGHDQLRHNQFGHNQATAYASCAQTGLMYMACGLGLWRLVEWHLCLHVVALTAGHLGWVRQGVGRLRPWPATAAGAPAPVRRPWLVAAIDGLLLKQIRGLARDLNHFDAHIIDQRLGVAANNGQGRPLPPSAGGGVIGQLTGWAALLTHGVDDWLRMRGLNRLAARHGRRLGRWANRLERFLLRPRYLLLFMLITFLMAF